MPTSISPSTLEKFTTFGDLLRFLRRRTGITQMELSIAVGYSDAQICRLEQNLRLPDPPTIEARFVPALCLENEPKAVARLMELAANVRREDAPEPGLCPYKGLDYFDEGDAALFVGREALTTKLADWVLSLTSKKGFVNERFFAIVGASGSGKSSLVRAGLVPALRWDKRSANWQIRVLTPTAHPLEALTAEITQDLGSVAATTTIMNDLRKDRRSLSLSIKRELRMTGSSHFLLVVDQFEELFSLCRYEEERAAFIDNLLAVTSEPDGQAIVVITLRADFYAHCASYLKLRNALAAHQEYIGAMSDDEMRRAIEEPARRGRWEFEPGLVDLILYDVGHEPGALPLLSHALLETWQRRHGRTLTLSGYISSGGVRGAIAETAEAVFTDIFTHQQQAIARRIFLRLTELGEETSTGDTRRRATFSELILKPEEREATQAVLKALADARLVTTSEDSVQVAHEALIREWPTLRGWLEDNREGLRLHRQLTEATQEWLETEREPSLLFRGARLAQAREWSVLHVEDMNLQEREFLDASITSSEREAAEREAQYQRELAAAQRIADTEQQRAEEGFKSARRLRRRAIIASSFGVLALVLAILAFFAWKRSASQAAINRSLNLASYAEKANQAGKGEVALALAMEAVKIDNPPIEALQVLQSISLGTGIRAILKGHNYSAETVAISNDREIALSGGCAQIGNQGVCLAGELILWDLDTLKELHRWTGHTSGVTAVAISLDRQNLISGAADGSLILWDLSGKPIGQFKGHAGSIIDMEIVSATGNLLTGSTDGSMILWDLKTGDILQRFVATTSPISSMAIAPRVPVAVSGHEDGGLFLWDLDNPHPILDKPQGVQVNTVALNSDGSRIFLTLEYMMALLLDSKDGSVQDEYSLACEAEDMVLSPDGSTAFISCVSFVLQWDMLNWKDQGIYQTSKKYLNAIAISPDGKLAISPAQDGDLIVWNIGPQLAYNIKNFSVDELTAVDISPDGNYLLLNDGSSADNINTPVLWDIAEEITIHTYPSLFTNSPPNTAKISPDSHYIAAAGNESDTPTVIVWDLEKQEVDCKRQDFKVGARSLAFSPDSQSLLVGSQGSPQDQSGQLILYDIKTCSIVRYFDVTKDVASIVFDADGTHALTGCGYCGRAILWDVSTGKEIQSFSYREGGPVLGVAFGPGESTVLGSGDADLYMWDKVTGEIVQRYIGSSGLQWNVLVSPDNKYVASSALNGDVTLWDYSTEKWLNSITLSGSANSAVFSPDGKYLYAVSMNGELLQWNVSEKSLPELLVWINSNRYTRPFTCGEVEQYHLGSAVACTP